MPTRLSGCRILVVEDEYWIAVELADWLKAEGAVIIGLVNRAEDARSMLAASTCDAVVLDIKLADQDGYEVADNLTQRAIPFIFSTGYDPKLIPDRFRSVTCLTKPHDLDVVIRELIRLLGRSPER